ncbi:MAG TPA: sigma factor-like helix-turn-helix DNA-binding protein [Stellaceae bacterium]|nr:sigma factor-like helix-turn-helix DNA-binding protein [Stellaceae bacterium]
MTTAATTASIHGILGALPRLRRYSHALAGDRRLGDRYVEVALEILAEEPWHLREGGDLRCDLYRLLHRVRDALAMPEPEADASADEEQEDILALLRSLPLASRKLLLLTAVEGLSLRRAAEIVELPPEVARVLLARARLALAERPQPEPNPSMWSKPCLSQHSTSASI